MNVLKLVRDNQLVDLLMNGNIGLEKEGLRVKIHAELAETDHPISLGNPEINKYFKTDYGESMPELITPPLAPFKNSYHFLNFLSYVLMTNLPEDEYIWPFSVPCKIPEDDDEIRISKTKNRELIEYRQYTASKYGKSKQLINGIHVNYSFNDLLIKRLYAIQNDYHSLTKFKNELYLKLASNFLKHQWLLVYLFGASPIAEKSFFTGPLLLEKGIPKMPMRSIRNSEYGFINKNEFTIRYNSLSNYMEDLQSAVNKGFLRQEREYYGDVRLRGVLKDSSNLKEKGIEYVELRSFDNDPFHVSGLSEKTLKFIYLFLITMLGLEGKASPEEVEKGKYLKRLVASEHPYEKTTELEEGKQLLLEMENSIKILELEDSYLSVVKQAEEALSIPKKTKSGKIWTLLNKKERYLEVGEKLGKEHKSLIISRPDLKAFKNESWSSKEKIIKILVEGTMDLSEYLK